jgi:hypothetical protein
LGSIVAYLKQDPEADLQSSPPSQRERGCCKSIILSRRILHFTATSNPILASKRVRRRLDCGNHHDWKWLVTSHVSRHGTFKLDELFAVQELAAQFGKRTKRQHCHGLWLGRLREDLFWCGEGRLRGDVGKQPLLVLGLGNWRNLLLRVLKNWSGVAEPSPWLLLLPNGD